MTTMENDPSKSMIEDLMTSTDFVAIPNDNMTPISTSEISKDQEESKSDLIKSTCTETSKSDLIKSTCTELSKSSISDSFVHVKSNQVSFHDVPHLWPIDGDMTVYYSLNDTVLKPGDKIALYKVGWIYLSEYITFVRVPVDVDPKERLSVTFKAETFPKNSSDLYQVCYLTADNTIDGASTVFNFHTPDETEVGDEDAYNPGIVVFKARIGCLQSELKKKVEANESLTIRYELSQSNFLILQKEFMKCEETIKQNEETIQKKESMINEKNQELLKLQEETDTLKAEIENLKVQTKTEEKDETINLLKKIDDLTVDKKVLEERLSNNQMLEQEQARQMEILQEKIDNVVNQDYKLYRYGRLVLGLAEENESLKMEEDLSKLQNDIEMNHINVTFGDKLILDESLQLKSNDQSLRIKELEEQLMKTPTFQMPNDQSSRIKELEDELMKRPTFQMADDQSSRIKELEDELLKRPTFQMADDQSLRIKELEDELMKRPTFQMANTLVELMNEKSELETKLSDSLNDQAAHKSRINVLELEVNSLRNQLTTSSVLTQKMFEQLQLFNQNIPNITSLNSFMDASVYFNSLIQKERDEKIQLQHKIEELLKQDAEMCQKLNDISKTLRQNSGSVPPSSYVSDQNKIDKVMKEKHTLEQQFNELRKQYVGSISVDLTKELHEKIETLVKHVNEKEIQIQSLEKKLLDKNNGRQYNYKKYIFGIAISYLLILFLSLFEKKEKKTEFTFGQLFGF